jgi:hypothetical protein
MDLSLISSFIIILVLVISLPTILIMGVMWWCVREIRLKIEKKIDTYHTETLKMMSDFQDIQKDFLMMTKQVDELRIKMERMEKKK